MTWPTSAWVLSLLLVSVSSAPAATVELFDIEQIDEVRLRASVRIQQAGNTSALQWRLESSGVQLTSVSAEKAPGSAGSRRVICAPKTNGLACLTYDPGSSVLGSGTIAYMTLVRSSAQDWNNASFRLTGVRAASVGGDVRQVNSSTAWVFAEGGNRIPEADEASVVATSGVPIQIELSASDADGDALTFSVVQDVTRGSLEQVGSTVIYQSEEDYTGVDGFTYRVTDGRGGQAEAHVTIFVEPVITTPPPGPPPPGPPPPGPPPPGPPPGPPPPGGPPPEETLGPVIQVESHYSLSLGQTIRFTVGVEPGSGLTAWLSATNMPPGASFDAASGDFVWTPTKAGTYQVDFLAVNNEQQTTGRTVLITVHPGAAEISLANAATFSTTTPCSPGALASLFNATSATGQLGEQAAGFPLPETLHRLTLYVNGEPAPLLYASDDQINFQCPITEPGTALELNVEGASWQSSPVVSSMAWASPGIFTMDGSGTGQGIIVQIESGRIAAMPGNDWSGQPAHPGDYISIYATGLGPVSTSPVPGEPASLTQLNPTIAPVKVRVGGVSAQVLFAGLAPGFAGLYQVNAHLPKVTQLGAEVPLRIDVELPDGSTVTSNVATFAITPRPIGQ